MHGNIVERIRGTCIEAARSRAQRRQTAEDDGRQDQVGTGAAYGPIVSVVEVGKLRARL